MALLMKELVTVGNLVADEVGSNGGEEAGASEVKESANEARYHGGWRREGIVGVPKGRKVVAARVGERT